MPNPDHTESHDLKKPMLTALLIACFTLAVFAPAFQAGFVDYDDPLYVTANAWVMRGMHLDTLKLAWTERVAGNWHPVTMMSHLLDVSLFGMNPTGHHVTSILLHTFNAVLLFGLLRSLFGGLFRPALAAALFAVHPFNLDSAVWIAERKNVLSTFFWLSATWLYVRYTRRPSVGSMLGTVFLFALGLMSKPMLVTFPITLLMLDLWPLRRVSGFTIVDGPVWKRLCLEKMMLFMLAAAFIGVTLLTQFPKGYVHSPTETPIWARPLFAMEHYIMYLSKFVWPEGLCVFYPKLAMPPDPGAIGLSALLLLIITSSVLIAIRKAPAWAFGWFWFLGTMLPVIGLIGVGQHSIADRYMYVPMIGLLVALVWGIPVFRRPASQWITGMIAVAATLSYAGVTRSLISHWVDSESLFQRSLAVTERNHVMLGNLGRLRMIDGRDEEAISLFREALEIEPNHVESLNNLGFATAKQGREEEAIRLFESAVQVDPRHLTARLNLARSMMSLGRFDEALQQYQVLLKLDPDSIEAREGLLAARQRLGLSTDWIQR